MVNFWVVGQFEQIGQLVNRPQRKPKVNMLFISKFCKSLCLSFFAICHTIFIKELWMDHNKKKNLPKIWGRTNFISNKYISRRKLLLKWQTNHHHTREETFRFSHQKHYRSHILPLFFSSLSSHHLHSIPIRPM